MECLSAASRDDNRSDTRQSRLSSSRTAETERRADSFSVRQADTDDRRSEATGSNTSAAAEQHKNAARGFSQESARHTVSHESRSASAVSDYSDSRRADSFYRDDTKPRHNAQQDKNRYHQRFREAARAEESNTRPSKLFFAADELPDQDAANRMLEKAQARAERFESRLHKAERKLPSKHRPRISVSADPEIGKSKKRLRFEKEIKSQSAALNGPAALKPIKGAAGIAGGVIHNQIYRNEQENVGIQAAHRAEIVGEAGLRSANRARKLAPYNKVKRLQNKTVNAQAKAAYQKALADNPALKKKRLAKLDYKKQLKRKYAKAAREAQKAGKRAKNTAVTTEKIAKKVVQAVKNHPVACLVIALLLLLIFFIMSVFSSCSSMGASTGGLFTAASYQADDYTISQAELTYTEWETDLQMEIDDIENTHPGYDEYHYQIDAIEHDPYVLMGYLTAVYGEFDSATAETAMRGLFNSQYNLSVTEEVQRKTRTESRTDPTTHRQSATEVEYEYKILNVKLTTTPLERVVASRMNAEQKEICELLMTTKGCRQYVGNVFGDTNWIPYVTSYYGYRVHPISGDKNYHTGVDIGMSQGTEIRAGHDGTVTIAGENGGYGLCVELSGETPEGKNLVTKYGHCSQILVSVGDTVSAGDVIAKVGSTGNSTGPHLHLEVLVDGDYLNPLFFAETGDETERHLPTGTGRSGSYTNYSVPPSALSDARFKAILTEAEKYLGYPYVWGGSSPEESFDCSGFVSWVINHSGWDVGRQGVLGLEDFCTTIAPSEAKPGDLIFFERTYDVVGASHVGIYVGDGMMIHCGDPISYTSINTSYWQEHFLHFGRLS
ncbi:MAG: peptidoglycan DD-metalloendopeptidase family protein [Ruminococcus sp.]|nr:peptidoglycan DD-metalloendopeptidase family protein [Ruminococcus sp.]